jgi:hypothetical protein
MAKAVFSTLAILLALLGPCGRFTEVRAQDDDQVLSDLAGPTQDFSPAGFFQGPIQIPDIVRFRKLPHRMNYEPFISDPIRIYELGQDYVPMCVRVLGESTDPEVIEVAALQLYRFAQEKLSDISSAESVLKSVLTTTRSARVRAACALAIAAGNLKTLAPELLAYTATAADTERVILESALASWKYAPARELWRKRIASLPESATAVRLACEGLAALNDTESAAQLQKMATDSTMDYLKRMSAAAASARLNPAESTVQAAGLLQRSETERLIGVAFLDSQDPKGLETAVQLCSDPEDAVASAAWQVVYRQNSQLLQPLLDNGRRHNDAVVRMTAARVMRQFPDAQRVNWLHQQLSDIHIQVRNVARQQLRLVAIEKTELKDQIIGLCADSLKPESPDWQGIEQCLILLGQLRASAFSAQCVELLNYPRNEVMVSAGWLIHLFPDIAVRELVLKGALDAEARLSDPAEEGREHGLKQAFLFQYLGIMRVREIEETLAKNFSKGVPGPQERRGASMWALGLLHEKVPDPALAARFHERIQDRSSPNPERAIVRRFSLIALGMMRSTASQPIVQESWQIDDASDGLRGAARWTHPLVGLELPEPIAPYLYAVGGWRLNPFED